MNVVGFHLFWTAVISVCSVGTVMTTKHFGQLLNPSPSRFWPNPFVPKRGGSGHWILSTLSPDGRVESTIANFGTSAHVGLTTHKQPYWARTPTINKQLGSSPRPSSNPPHLVYTKPLRSDLKHDGGDFGPDLLASKNNFQGPSLLNKAPGKRRKGPHISFPFGSQRKVLTSSPDEVGSFSAAKDHLKGIGQRGLIHGTDRRPGMSHSSSKMAFRGPSDEPSAGFPSNSILGKLNMAGNRHPAGFSGIVQTPHFFPGQEFRPVRAARFFGNKGLVPALPPVVESSLIYTGSGLLLTQNPTYELWPWYSIASTKHIQADSNSVVWYPHSRIGLSAAFFPGIELSLTGPGSEPQSLAFPQMGIPLPARFKNRFQSFDLNERSSSQMTIPLFPVLYSESAVQQMISRFIDRKLYELLAEKGKPGRPRTLQIQPRAPRGLLSVYHDSDSVLGRESSTENKGVYYGAGQRSTLFSKWPIIGGFRGMRGEKNYRSQVDDRADGTGSDWRPLRWGGHRDRHFGRRPTRSIDYWDPQVQMERSLGNLPYQEAPRLAPYFDSEYVIYGDEDDLEPAPGCFDDIFDC